MGYIPGPDFPTAGFIYGTQGIKDAYETGRGLLTVRAKADIEVDERTDRGRIIVSELPYQVNKAKLIEKIAGTNLIGTASESSSNSSATRIPPSF